MATKAHKRRIESATRRLREAQTRLTRTYEAQREALEAVTRKHSSKLWDAEKKCYAARAAVTTAELAAHGIKPMQTIILYHPRYTGITAQQRYVVNIKREGYPELLPVGVKGRLLANRNPALRPYDWSKVTVTADILKEQPQ